MEKFDHTQLDAKWQAYWSESGVFRAEPKSKLPKFYCLDMFAYPSGEGLHVGHPRGYTASDVMAKYYKLRGHNVLHPFGWDAFGLPTENYALKVGMSPREATDKNVENFKRQLTSFGFGYDWTREIDTSRPEFYKWTQWLFKILFDAGLAYQKEAYVNWCPKDQTVLANEQVVAGCCERCGTVIEQRKLTQWFFKITEFADELIDGLEKIDWPQSTKESQRNWIGKSVGAEIDFQISESAGLSAGESVRVFTTRPDTLFGVTFLVISPEKAREWINAGWQPSDEVARYIDTALGRLERDRLEGAGDKTGVDSGVFALHPLTGEALPIWVADYVVGSYGTGAIMAVPAHDDRDFAFAKKFKLAVKAVVAGGELPTPAKGELIDSGEWTGMQFEEVMEKIESGAYGWASPAVQYKLRDWSVSRQRYWGSPIPIVYKADGTATSVGFDELPVLLPEDAEIKPTGVAPLSTSASFNAGIEEKYGAGAKREVDTLDTFVCSSWYYLRYCDPGNSAEFAGKESLKSWMPVDLYVGGAEHTNGHLLYARFITKALHRLGYVDFDEPFLRLRHQGFILGENGEKMSKSRGNVVNPDSVVAEYGADSLRMFEMFVGPFDQSTPWDTKGVVGVRRFLDKVWRMAQDSAETGTGDGVAINKLVKQVTHDLEAFKFNTVVSGFMEYLNTVKATWEHSDLEVFTRLIAPLAPHLAEEVWQNVLKHDTSVFAARWPSFDETKVVDAIINIAVQENGKLRGTVSVEKGADEDRVLQEIAADEKLAKVAEGTGKRVFVADKIINFIR